MQTASFFGLTITLITLQTFEET